MFWEPSSYSRVCSVHFKLSDFTNSKSGKRVLIKSAVPTENIPKKLTSKSSAQLAYLEDHGKSAVGFNPEIREEQKVNRNTYFPSLSFHDYCFI